MYSRIISPPHDQSFFLFGPRGTGKTTWVRNQFAGAIYLDLLQARVFNQLLADPQKLEDMIPALYGGWVVIDEIQRAPDLLHEVHRLIEAKKYKFVLTGSSARKLRRKGVNLLGGRALMHTLYPLTVKELGGDFDLKHSLTYGHLPGAYIRSKPQDYLNGYVRVYLEEEIKQEGLTRNLSAFARFLEAASFSQGNILNISEVARECSVERKVVENYFSILEDLMIAYRVPVFTKKARRRMVSHPKFYFFDAGVFSTIRPQGLLDAPQEAQGVAAETLVLQELRALNDYFHWQYKIYFWRTADQQEVDFVLYGPRGLKAIEVKRTANVSNRHLSGLKAFLKDYPMAKGYLFYGGRQRLYFDKIQVWPIGEALKKIEELL
ncbi:MAG: ATP-binding protein [Candidatus Omnitrophica bacterium]|nr:ATP-binding protein [Candidatus Omnitrophota bacterium]